MKRTGLLFSLLGIAIAVSAYFPLKKFLITKINTGIIIPVLAPPSSAGYIPGDFSVGMSGNPNYSIPLDVPIGTNHVQPDLTLTYSNIKSNGILGTGWNLTGLTVVTRIGKIIPQDSIRGGVNLDANDRFAMNGERLIAYRDKSGKLLTTVGERDAAYGKDGTEYRTEVETWVKVFSWGDCGKGPCAFTAFTKDGSQMQFAHTPDSRIQPDGSPVIMAWAVNKVIDSNENYVTVSYGQDRRSGSYLPSQILYTGNDRGHLVPQRMIEFTAEGRPDTLVNYIGGVKTSCTARIKNVNTYVDLDGDGKNIGDKSNLVKTYSLAYASSSATGRSLIDSVVVRDPHGNALPGTHFTWTKIDTAHYFSDTLPPLPHAFREVLSFDVKKIKADFNGDGRVDIALLKSKSPVITVIFTDANFSFTTTQKPVPPGFSIYLNESNIEPLTGDFNGDGLTDIAFFKDRSNTVPILFSQTDGSFRGKMIPLAPDFNQIFNTSAVTKYTGDFNGDGLSDVAGFANGYRNVPLLITLPAGGFDCKLTPIPKQVVRYVNSPGCKQILCDINGDAITDVACFNQGYQSVPILFGLGNGKFSSAFKQLPEQVRQHINAPGVQHIPGDYNGDGLSDIAVFNTGYTTIPVIYSTGDGSFAGDRIPLPGSAARLFNGPSSEIVTGDLNADDITDFTAFNDDAKSVPVLFSGASGTYAYTLINISQEVARHINAQDVERFVSDFNGDGLIDIAALKQGYTSLPVLVSNKIRTENNLPDLMVAVTDGIRGYTQATYRPVSGISGFRADTTLRYPFMSVQFPQFVVTHTVSGGEKASSVIMHRYSYESPIIDHFRGWLGFKKTVIADAQTKTLSHTYYRVRFPFMGIMEKQEVTDESDPTEIFSRIRYSYASEPDGLSGVTRLWNTSYEMDHYTRGHYNYTKKKNFIYDDDRKVIRRIHDLGDIAIPDDDFYTGFLYGDYSDRLGDWWKHFFPISERTYTDSSDHTNWKAWTSSDLAWKKYGYDATMNLKTQSSYVDHNGAEPIHAWTGSSTAYDVFGNPVAQSFPSNYSGDSIVSSITYDAVFHTFPATVTSPVPTPGLPGSEPLTTQSAYDPRFALKMLEIDANQHTVYQVPDNGVDGFGRLLFVYGTEPSTTNKVVRSVYSYQRGSGAGYSITQNSPVQWVNTPAPDSTWLWDRQVYDGLGREIKTERNGYNAHTNLVTLTGFNIRGQLEKQFLPFFYNAAQGIHYNQGGPSRGDSLFILQKYNRNGLLKSLWSPAPESGQSKFLAKEYIYDSLDDRTAYVREPSPANDAVFVRWKEVFDSNGRLVQKSGPYNDDGSKAANFSSATYQYDRLARPVRTIDPINDTTAYGYNSLGHVIREYRSETGTVKNVFNAHSWITSRISDQGRIDFRYDDLGRVIRKIATVHDHPLSDTTVFVYDNDAISGNGKGRLSSVMLSSGHYSYRYDNTGMISQKNIYLREFGKTCTQTFVYDASGRLTTSVYPDSTVAKYNYKHGYNLSSVCLNGDTLASFRKYNAFDAYEEVDYLNAVNSRLQYDNLGRPISSTTAKDAYTHRKFDYAWTRANKLQSITDKRQTRDIDLSQNFGYYSSGRLYTAEGPYGKENYTYDAAGNRMTDSESLYKYDPVKKHQLASVSQKNVVAYHLAYDAAGNLSEKTFPIKRKPKRSNHETPVSAPGHEIHYDFDAEGNLRQVHSKSGDSTIMINSFSYDDAGVRTIKRDSGNIVTYYFSPVFEAVKLPSGKYIYTSYVWDAGNVIFSRTVAGENVKLVTSLQDHAYSFTFPAHLKDPYVLQTGLIALTFVLILAWCILESIRRPWCSKRWICGMMLWAGVILVNEPAHAELPQRNKGGGIPEAGQVRFYHHDHLGSSVLLTDMTGGLTNHITYAPFGTIDKASSDGKNNFRPKFTGKEKDENIDLYYFGSRYYDSDIGRFISTDRAQQYFSPYIYGDNDPLSGTDPDGNSFTGFEIALIVAATAGTYVGASLANGSFNPANWEWSSAKTWVGMVTGALSGVAAVASGGAALSRFGIVAAASVTVSNISAGTLAFVAADISFLTSDAYAFSKDQTASNGIFLALDMVPFAGSLLGEGAHAGNAAMKAENAALHEVEAGAHIEMQDLSALGECLQSFTAGTAVRTPDGTKPIEQIEVGDEVMGYDMDKNETRPYAVSAIFSRIATGLVIMVTSCGDTIAVTPEHPFYVPNKGWTDAVALQKNDPLLNFNSLHQAYASTRANSATTPGEYVVNIKYVRDTVARVYNLEVEEAHNYFASASSVLVHNPRGCLQRAVVAKQYGKKSRYGRLIKQVPRGMEPIAPAVLLDGPASTHVYLGYTKGELVYSGITRRSIAARQAEHEGRFTIRKVTRRQVTKKQARSLEQYFINRYPGMQNIATSVSSHHDWYEVGQAWADAYLRHTQFIK